MTDAAVNRRTFLTAAGVAGAAASGLAAGTPAGAVPAADPDAPGGISVRIGTAGIGSGMPLVGYNTDLRPVIFDRPTGERVRGELGRRQMQLVRNVIDRD